MLRFQPDSFIEGLLRPFVMADPLVGIYFETSAPDWRFAALALAGLAVALAATRRRAVATAAFTQPQQAALWGLVLTFAFWTATVGNGRYFVTGLLWVGPLVVLVSRRLPGSATLRWLLVAMLAGLQLFATLDVHGPNRWGMVRWSHGPGLAVAPSPLRERPAVFLTLSNISYSLLVPAFHAESRWVNLVGQTDIVPAMPEFARLHRALASGLPVYAVGPYLPSHLDAAGRLQGTRRDDVISALAPHGYAPADAPCVVIDSPLSSFSNQAVDGTMAPRGFSFCPAVPSAATAAATAVDATARSAREERLDAAFDLIERRCPRYFPPGTAVRRSYLDIVTRMYSASDARLHIDGADNVLFHHIRAINPTLVGSLDDVLAGRFTIPCEKLPGRYQLPWQRD